MERKEPITQEYAGHHKEWKRKLASSAVYDFQHALPDPSLVCVYHPAVMSVWHYTHPELFRAGPDQITKTSVFARLETALGQSANQRLR